MTNKPKNPLVEGIKKAGAVVAIGSKIVGGISSNPPANASRMMRELVQYTTESNKQSNKQSSQPRGTGKKSGGKPK